MERRQASNFEPPRQTGMMTEQLRAALSITEIGGSDVDVDTGTEDCAPVTASFVNPSVLGIEALMVGTNGKVIQLRTATVESYPACKWHYFKDTQPARSQRFNISAKFPGTGRVALSSGVWCNCR
jgi:hypothetical protein